MPDSELTVGILGGMGPAATHRFFGLLVDETGADSDQNHLRIVMDNNPKIPDRTEYLVDNGTNPLPELRNTARNVERFGAELLTIPCNTSHAFVDEIGAAVNIPVMDMIDMTVREIDGQEGQVDNVGLMATSGTIESGIYQGRTKGSGINLQLPDPRGQEQIMSAIYGDAGIKAGYRDEPKELLLDTVERSFANVDALIAGCTEIPLVLSDSDVKFPLVDPLEILASNAVTRAKNGRQYA